MNHAGRESSQQLLTLPGTYVREPTTYARIRGALARGEYVALVGPRRCGKTLLLRDIWQSLQAEPDLACPYLNLTESHAHRPAELFRDLALAIHETNSPAELAELPLLPEDVGSSQDFRYYLSQLLISTPRSIVLGVDHIESVPRYLAKALLRCFRVTFSEREVRPELFGFTVIAAGALDLFQLTVSHVSPFNIATLISIPDADEAQSRELIDKIASQGGLDFSANAVERILRATNGDRYLVDHLCRSSAQQPVWTSPRITERAVDLAIQDMSVPDPAINPCLAERVRAVESDADVLLTVLEVLAGQSVKRRELSTGIDSVELTGVIRLEHNRYVIRSPMCQRALEQYFAARRVARLFSVHGRWADAIRYFEQGELAAGQPETAEYLAAVVNQIYGEEDEEQAFRLLARALEKALGVNQLCVYRTGDDSQWLEPVICSGMDGSAEPPVISLLERSDRPESRAFDGEDYLLEEDEGGNSLLVFPLQSGGRQPNAGVVTIINLFPVEGFSRRRGQVLEIMGFLAQAGRALASLRERQGLLRRERQRVEALTGLSDVTKAITVVRELEDVLSHVVDNALAVLNADMVSMYLYDSPTRAFHTPMGVGLLDEKRFQDLALPRPDGSIAGEIIRRQRALFFEDAPGQPPGPKTPFARREGIRSVAGYPLVTAGQPVGVLFVSFRRPHLFSEAERQIINAFAEQAAIAIDNAHLYQALADDRKTLADLYALSTTLRDSLNPVDVQAAITAGLQEMLGLSTCTIGLLDSSETRLDFVAHRGLEAAITRNVAELPQDLWRIVRHEGQHVLVDDVRRHPALGQVLERSDLRAFAVLPLVGRKVFIGILTMGSTEHLEIDQAAWNLIRAMANQAAVAIENAQLHQDLQAAHQALDDSLKVLTHQLRAEPAYVSNTLSTLLAGRLGHLDDVQQDRLYKAQRRLDQHHRLIDGLNLYGRLKGGRIVQEIEETQLADLAGEILDEYQAAAAWRDLELKATLSEVPPVTVDRTMIGIVLVNLIDNALKFTPRGGKVRVETFADAAGIHMVVDDTGPGIAAGDRERIFDEYHTGTTKREKQGAGLGLYIAKRLVEMHNGRIAVVDKAGPGSRLEVILVPWREVGA